MVEKRHTDTPEYISDDSGQQRIGYPNGGQQDGHRKDKIENQEITVDLTRPIIAPNHPMPAMGSQIVGIERIIAQRTP